MKYWTTIGTFAGACLGLALGWIYGESMVAVKWMGDLFLHALRFLVMPLIISAMIVGVTSLGDVRKLGKMGGITITYFLCTTMISVAIGLLLVVVLKPGVGQGLGEAMVPDRIIQMKDYSFGDFILSFVGGGSTGKNANLFYSLTNLEILPVIIFSLVFGGILTTVGEHGKTVINFFKGFYEAIMIMVQGLILLAPIGVFGLVASKIGAVGGGEAVLLELKKVGMYSFTVVLGLAIHGVIILPLVLRFIAGRNVFGYLKGMAEALLTAFSTASSAATLPVTTRNITKHNKISEKNANFVLPIGATINMDGTALYEGVAVVFISQVLGIELSFMQLLLVFVLSTLAAIAAAAVPEAGLVTMVVILQAVNLPLDAIGLLLAVDWFLDRCRTTVNVWGDSIGVAVVEKFQKIIGSVTLRAV